MEFTNFNNYIKTEQVGAWASPPVPHVTDRQKVNPFMQWAVFSAGMVASTTPAANSESSKDEESGRSGTITASTALETGRQVVTSAQSLQGYNHVQPMLPIEAHTQQNQQHEQQAAHEQQQANAHAQPEMIENSAHVTPVASPHPGQHQQPANDTAFPGGQLRHNYTIHQQQQQQHHQSHLLSALSHPAAAKQIQKTPQGQSYLDNGEEERNARGEKIERVYHCPDCEKSFTREEHLKRHCRIHTDDPVHRCEVAGCTKSYTRKERLTRHYKVAHLGQQPERPFWCADCGKDFQRKEHLQRHQKNIHGPSGPHPSGTVIPVMHHSVQTPGPQAHHAQQQQQQQQQQQPQQQQNMSQNNSSSANNGVGLLHCSYDGCPKTYSRREHLNRHHRMHEGIEPERPYYCTDCHKAFTRKEHLLRHKRAHTGETPYPCPVGPDCSKQFARKEHLKRHVRVHTGEHPYPCSDSFGRRERLIKHMKSHGIGGNIPPVQKMEFKKEPDNDMQMGSHGVFGDQTHQLLNMIAKKGPLTPEQLGIAAPTAQHDLLNPEVAKALSNPEIVRAFHNPEVVKAFALGSPPKHNAARPVSTTASMANVVQTPQAMSRSVDITCTPTVPAELAKLPPGFSIFPVVPTSIQDTQAQSQVVATVPSGYYQNQGHVAHTHLKPGELTTIPMSWPAWPMQGVNIRSSPAKLEPSEAKHWEPTTAAYFRSFS